MRFALFVGLLMALRYRKFIVVNNPDPPFLSRYWFIKEVKSVPTKDGTVEITVPVQITDFLGYAGFFEQLKKDTYFLSFGR